MDRTNTYFYNTLGRTDNVVNFDFTDKCVARWYHIQNMLNRTQSMFRYDGLPDTIPQRILELMLQTFGYVTFYRHNGQLYVFRSSLGGEPDVYYMPTLSIISNPALALFKELKINDECVVMPNDSLYVGLMPILSHYASMTVENEITIREVLINSRIPDLISAQDDRTKASAEKFLKDIEDGKLGIIAETAFLDGLKTQPYGATGNNNTITNLIEFEQYWKASVFNELGLNANYNMKRESLNSEESQLNNDALLPLVDDMLKMRRDALEKVNEMFGTDISVDFASSWKDNIIEQAVELSERSENSEEVADEMLKDEDVKTDDIVETVNDAEEPEDEEKDDVEEPEDEEKDDAEK